MAVMQADLKLKQKPAFWETPRNLALIFGALVAGTAALTGLAGYKFGQSSPYKLSSSQDRSSHSRQSPLQPQRNDAG